jgi:hypothetical protein
MKFRKIRPENDREAKARATAAVNRPCQTVSPIYPKTQA